MPFILGTNSIKDTTYEVANSLRFNKGSSDYLNLTFGTSTSTKKCTYSCWVKRSRLDDDGGQYLFTFNDSGNAIYFNGSGTGAGSNEELVINSDSNFAFYTDDLYRDTSAWYHVVVAVDTTQGTASNRVKLYVNNVQVTSFGTATYPSQNADFNNLFSSNGVHEIGRGTATGGTEYFGGYMAEVVFIDGQQLDPTSFGEFDSDTNIWKPKNVSGLTFGNNGFYLDFENSSSLGADVSGNGNNFSVNNLTSIDQSTDTCTNNFPTMNPLILGSGTTLSEGNLQLNPGTNSTGFHSASTIGVSTGKWYWEAKLVSGTKGAFGIIFDGSSGNVFEHQRNNKMPGGFSGNANSWGYKPGNSGNVENNAADISFSGVTATSSNILGFAMDLDNDALYIHKDGTYMNSGNPTSGSSKTGAIDLSGGEAGFVFPAYGDSDTGASPSAAYNFGSPPYSESGGESDADGHGNFNQAVPSGYFAICSKNLAEYG